MLGLGVHAPTLRLTPVAPKFKHLKPRALQPQTNTLNAQPSASTPTSLSHQTLNLKLHSEFQMHQTLSPETPNPLHFKLSVVVLELAHNALSIRPELARMSQLERLQAHCREGEEIKKGFMGVGRSDLGSYKEFRGFSRNLVSGHVQDRDPTTIV